MANDFYQATGNPATRSQGQSAAMRAEFRDIEAAFGKMPTLTGNAGKAVVVNGGGTALGVTAGTLALAGNFATVGAFALALTLSGTTNVTLPTTGTLATLAGVETLTNKTLTAPTLTAPVLGTPASGNLVNCTGLPSGSIVGALPAANFPALTGDVTTPGGSLATTLATVNANVGTFGGGASVGTFTVDAKGRITAAANVTIAAPAGTLTGSTLAANVTASSLTSVGTITSGTWSGNVVAVDKGGTGTATAFAAGSVLFAGASGVYSADGGNLGWNNIDKTLGIGVAAPPGASWRTLIRSFGFGTYPLVMTAPVSGATIFYVGENGGVGGGSVSINNDANNTTVHLNSNGRSYFVGGNVGFGLTDPQYRLDVIGPNGNASIARVGNSGADRYIRFGVTGLGSGNSAVFLQGQHGNNDANVWHLLLNPFGVGVGIGGTRDPAAALDVTGSIAVGDGNYIYTPYDGGGANTGTIRAGIQVDGNSQSLNFITANTYRGGVLADGTLYLPQAIGARTVPNPAWTAALQVGGDIALRSAVATVQWNAYYDTAWRYASDGWPAALRTDGAGNLQLLGGAENTAGAGAALTPAQVMAWNLASGNVAVGNAVYGASWPKLEVNDSVDGALNSRVANYSSGPNAYVRLELNLPAHADLYATFDVFRSAGNPFAQLSCGPALTGGLYIGSTAHTTVRVNGADRMQITSSALNLTALGINATGSQAHSFNSLMLQSDGAASYIRATGGGFLFLGQDGTNSLLVSSAGLYSPAQAGSEIGNATNYFGAVSSRAFVAYGSTAPNNYTSLRAQASPANNTVYLPNDNDTLVGRATTDTLTNKTLTSPTLNSPTLTSPALGTPTSGNLANCSGYPVASVAGLGSNVAAFLANPTSGNLAAAVTGETGSGALVFGTSPTLSNPAFSTVISGGQTVTIPSLTGTLLVGGTQLSAALGADVALNNTSAYFNGPAVALPAGGTYLLIATLTIQDIASAANLDCRLWNGSASIGSARGWIASVGGITTVTLIGLSAGGVTITSQAADITSTGGALRWNLSGNQADSRIVAFKVAS